MGPLQPSWRWQHQPSGVATASRSSGNRQRLAWCTYTVCSAALPLRHQPAAQPCTQPLSRSRWHQHGCQPHMAAAASHQPAGGEPLAGDGQQAAESQQSQPQPQPTDGDPELPANLGLGASPSAAELLKGSPFQENPFSNPELRKEREQLNQLHAQIASQLQQPAGADASSTDAASADAAKVAAGAGATAAQPSAAPELEGMTKEEYLEKMLGQLRGEGQQQKEPWMSPLWPLGPLWRLLVAIFRRIRSALAAIPAIARRHRLENLKKVSPVWSNLGWSFLTRHALRTRWQHPT